MNAISHAEHVLDTPNVEMIATQSEETTLTRTSNQIYRKVKKKCDELCSLMAELPEDYYQDKLDLLDDLLRDVKRLTNHGRTVEPQESAINYAQDGNNDGNTLKFH